MGKYEWDSYNVPTLHQVKEQFQGKTTEDPKFKLTTLANEDSEMPPHVTVKCVELGINGWRQIPRDQ